MLRTMKTPLITLLLVCFTAAASFSQREYNVRATSYDISDNLDLEAVAYLFGDSRDLQEFEQRLNDPRTQISNLDLNNDGYVDYLRVVEQYEYGVHLVTIQAVLDRNVFQDVANIDVDRVNAGYSVQVIGHPYLYGPNYIIEPVYVRQPLIFAWFGRPHYVVWNSPYYWGYYPPRYRTYRCVPTYRYHRNLYVNVDIRVNTYNYSSARRNSRAYEIQRSVSRNDYGQRNPNRSFSQRNSGYNNKYDMNRSRSVFEQGGQRPAPAGNSRPGYEQRRTPPPSTGNSGSNRSTRQPEAQPSNQGQGRSYEYRGTSNQGANQSYSKPSTTNNPNTRQGETRQTTQPANSNVNTGTPSNQNNQGRSETRQSRSSSNAGNSGTTTRQSNRSDSPSRAQSTETKREQQSTKRSESNNSRSGERSRRQ